MSRSMKPATFDMEEKIIKTLLFFFLLLLFSFLFSPSHSYGASSYTELNIARALDKISEGDMMGALDLLNNVLQESPDNIEALFYAGIANSKAGNYETAEKQLIRVIQFDPDELEAYLELGNIYYSTSQCDKAYKHLNLFISRTDDDPLRKYAESLKNTCSDMSDDSPYLVVVTFAEQYDTNVILEQDNPPLESERKSDLRTLMYLTARYELLKGEKFTLNMDASFYQSIHTHLNDYNVKDYKLGPSINIPFTDAFSLSQSYTIQGTELGNDTYSKNHTLLTEMILKEGRLFSTEVLYEYQINDYFDSDSFLKNSTRSGFQNSIGIGQNIYSDSSEIALFVKRNYERARKDFWSNNGYEAGLDITLRLNDSLLLLISGSYQKQGYLEEIPVIKKTRHDEIVKGSVGLTYYVSKQINISLTDDYTANKSNIRFFDYERNIVSLFLSFAIL